MTKYKAPQKADWNEMDGWAIDRSKASCSWTHETCQNVIDGIPTKATIYAWVSWSMATTLGVRHETYKAWNPFLEQYCRFDTLPEATKWAVEQ